MTENDELKAQLRAVMREMEESLLKFVALRNFSEKQIAHIEQELAQSAEACGLDDYRLPDTSHRMIDMSKLGFLH